VRALAFAALAALAAGAARAQPTCPPPPSLEAPPAAPKDGQPTPARRDAAVRAGKAWSTPRLAYAACRRAELEAAGQALNQMAGRANLIVEEWNSLDRKVRAARAAHLDAARAYYERRGRAYQEAPIVVAPMRPPCERPENEGPPAAPDPRVATGAEMARSDAAFKSWMAARQSYLACRKVEGAAVIAAYAGAKTRYDAERKAYLAYRKTFNHSVAAFETAMDAYSRKVREHAPR